MNPKEIIEQIAREQKREFDSGPNLRKVAKRGHILTGCPRMQLQPLTYTTNCLDYND